jgi:hypothetical protein
MLLFSERTWKHHCVTLVLPIAVLSYYAAACRPPRRVRSLLVGSLVLLVVLMAASSTDLIGERVAKLVQVYGSYVAGYLVLLAALGVVLTRPLSRAVEHTMLRAQAAA